jgi:YD repeat-containing protein
MRIKRSGIFIALFFFFSISAFGQSSQYFIPGVFPQSPNTASQAKFGDYEVSMFTGIPNISIPLYEVKSGDLSVPITLSYHASGIKVAEVASWVGLGWSISAGGSVSRQVMGKPDDGDGGYLNDNVIPQWGIDQSTDVGLSRAWDFVKGSTDGRPDMFNYSFPGQSGKFFFNGTDHSLKPVLIPYSPIDIQYSKLTGSAKTITGFDIKDENGNNYQFGKVNRETTSGASPSQSFADYTSNWMMEKMISQNRRDTISFEFTSEYVRYPDETSDVAILSDVVDNKQSGSFTPGYQTNILSISSSTVNAMLQSAINFKNGKVVFEKDAAYRTDLEGGGNNNFGLNKIKIYNYNFSIKAMELQKTIVFYKSYFNPSVQFSRRLKLDSIQVLDKAGSVIQRYGFTYNESITLPPYTTRKKDYWGYYNGKDNTSLIPQQWVQYWPQAQNPVDSIKVGDPLIANGRDPDSLYMQAGVLTDIRFPTGGKTHFNYQTNQYRDDNNVLRLTGGLRVSSILSYTSDAAVPVVKTYKYLAARPNFVLNNSCFVNQQTYFQFSSYPSGTPLLIAQKRVRTFVSNSTRDLVSLDGAPVAYPVVEEYFGTLTTNIGKTKYEFTDFGSGFGTTYLAGSAIFNTYFFKRGQLRSKTDYSRMANGTYQPVRSESNSYVAFPEVTYVNAELIGRQGFVATGATQNPIYASTSVVPNDYSNHNFTLVNRDIIVGDNYKVGSTIRMFDQADTTKYTSSTVTYEYDNIKHQQVSRIRTTDSKGNTKVTVNKYPADYLTGSATTTSNGMLDALLNSNMQAAVVERWDSVKNVSSGINAVTGAQLNLYKTNGQGIVPDKIKKLSVTTPISDFTPASLNGVYNFIADSRYVQMISFDKYDSFNNVIQYSPRNAGLTQILWDYNNALPVVQIKNGSSDYDPYNTKPVFAFTSFEADSKGNWDFGGSPVVDLKAPTGIKVYPLIGTPISLNNADLSKPHVVSYWSDNGSATIGINSTTYPGTIKRSTNGWTLYEHKIPAISGSSTMTISGSLNVDELKTYPADALITTYTYDTNGLAQTTDEKGQISRFEYDEAQRLKNVKDWQGDIVKSYGYHSYNMTIGNDAIAATTFTRNNCPSGTIPGTTTYSVAANTYYSSTKASANTLAQYDLQTNGQAKANDPAICGCPIQYITFTFKDQTGLGTYQAVFTGPATKYVNMPSGTSTQPVAAGTYTLQVNAVGTQIKNFQLGNRSVITGRTATFNNVNVTPESTDLTLTIY